MTANAGTIQIQNSITLQSLTVGTSGTVALAPHTGDTPNVIDTSALAFFGITGSLDIGNAAMIVQGNDLTASAVLDGLQGNGALAIMGDNSQLYLDSFAGVSELGSFDEVAGNPIDFNQVLVKATYIGDLDGDGSVVPQTDVAGTGAVAASPEAVPEPGIFGLVFAAAAGLLGVRRNNRRRDC